MKFIETLKRLFSTNNDSKFPKNFTKYFENFELFMAYVNTTTDFDRHYVYFYQGDGKTLSGLISQDEYYGEKVIPDLSLNYVGNCKKVKNNLMVNDILFFPDMVFDLKNKYASLNDSIERHCLYKSDNNGCITIKSVVIASSNVYLCKK